MKFINSDTIKNFLFKAKIPVLILFLGIKN